MTAVILPIALIAYIVGILLATLSTIYQFRAARVGASVVFVVGWVAHLATVVDRGLSTGRFPLSSGPEYLLFLGLAVMTLHLLISLVWRVHIVGVVLPPLSAMTGFAAMALLPDGAPQASQTPRGLFLFHTTVSTLGMAMLIVALAMSILYVFQDRTLKSQGKLSLLGRLPPLDRCDHIGVQALAIGFVLFSLGILAGVVINTSVYGRFWEPGIKQTLPLLSWIIFAAVLFARFTLGFRGRKSAYLTITGVMLGLLTIVGMTL